MISGDMDEERGLGPKAADPTPAIDRRLDYFSQAEASTSFVVVEARLSCPYLTE